VPNTNTVKLDTAIVVAYPDTIFRSTLEIDPDVTPNKIVAAFKAASIGGLRLREEKKFKLGRFVSFSAQQAIKSASIYEAFNQK
jgi:hypothetical protein